MLHCLCLLLLSGFPSDGGAPQGVIITSHQLPHLECLFLPSSLSWPWLLLYLRTCPAATNTWMASQRPPLFQCSSFFLRIPAFPISPRLQIQISSGGIQANTSTGFTDPSEPPDSDFLDLCPHHPPAVAWTSPKPEGWLNAPWSSLPPGPLGGSTMTFGSLT